jgi:GNAT superfamily N-acetyltransferase
MLTDELTYLDIEWEMKLGGGLCREGIDDEPESYVACYEGRIFANEDDDLRRHIGHVSARRCLLGEASPFLVLDAEMELETYCALFARSGWFLERVAQMPGDLLVLDRLGLISEYRGRDLGLTIIREVTRELGSGCAVVALIPAALNYEHATGRFTRANDTIGTKKLERHYRRLAFRKLGDVMHFDQSLTMKVPNDRASYRAVRLPTAAEKSATPRVL